MEKVKRRANIQSIKGNLKQEKRLQEKGEEEIFLSAFIKKLFYLKPHHMEDKHR